MSRDLTRICVAALTVFALAAPPVGAQEDEPFDLAAAAERYCFSAFGNHVLGRQRAEDDGFTYLTAADVDSVRLPGPRWLRGMHKTINGVEVRLLTSMIRIRGGGQGENYFRACWVSATPWSRAPVDARIRQIVDTPRFRNRDAWVYAWTTSPDGRQHPVNRRQFETVSLRDSLEDDLQIVMTQQEGDMVAVTYMVPATALEDGG
ncbi:MAG: hypothetical protein EOP67_32480 [Sphingomonas sp.]|nr:MAG: hypothetical protein EOP67_32480 [Sphingomonas sp.]